MRIIGLLLICTLCSAIAYKIGYSSAFKANIEFESPDEQTLNDKEKPSIDVNETNKSDISESSASNSEESASLRKEEDCISPAEFDNRLETLITQFKSTKRQLHDTQNDLRHAQATLKEAGLELPQTITREKIEKTLPAPFTDVIANADFGVRET